MHVRNQSMKVQVCEGCVCGEGCDARGGPSVSCSPG